MAEAEIAPLNRLQESDYYTEPLWLKMLMILS